jgi:GTP-binding protein
LIPDLESRSLRTPDHGYRIPTVKVINTEFVTSAAAGGRADDIPGDGLAQIAFAGRSNVGKSTLLNALTRTKRARTSAAPGKTRLANIYRVTLEGGPGGPGRWSAYFVDLPGYGYARGGHDAAAELAAVAAAYFESATPQNRTVLHLIDARHPALQADIDAARWFDAIGVERHVVATKVDKLNRSERTRNLKELERIFGRAPLPVSAASGEGLDELWRLIARAAKERHR